MNTYGSPRPTVDYLEARVTTASAAELQLMLLDGGLRFGRRALSLWDDPAQFGEVYQLLTRVMDIMEAATTGVAGSDDPVAGRLEEQYAFLFREFAALLVNQDKARLERALELLAYERQTWQLACERAKSGDETPTPPNQRELAPHRTRATHADTTLPTGGFSVQA